MPSIASDGYDGEKTSIQVHALTKPLAGLEPQIDVRITVKSKVDGDLSAANAILNKIKSGWKL
jgi:hypothetical protein